MADKTRTITITQAEYLTDTKMFKVQATTTFANSILTYGTDVSVGPLGTMQFELGSFEGSIILPSAPKTVTVWNSNGGFTTMNVTVKTPKTATGGGGTATGGGGTATGGGGLPASFAVGTNGTSGTQSFTGLTPGTFSISENVAPTSSSTRSRCRSVTSTLTDALG